MLAINPIRTYSRNNNQKQSFGGVIDMNAETFDGIVRQNARNANINDAVHDLVYKATGGNSIESLKLIHSASIMFDRLAEVGDDSVKEIAGIAKRKLEEMREFYGRSVSHGTGFHK